MQSIGMKHLHAVAFIHKAVTLKSGMQDGNGCGNVNPIRENGSAWNGEDWDRRATEKGGTEVA